MQSSDMTYKVEREEFRAYRSRVLSQYLSDKLSAILPQCLWPPENRACKALPRLKKGFGKRESAPAPVFFGVQARSRPWRILNPGQSRPGSCPYLKGIG